MQHDRAKTSMHKTVKLIAAVNKSKLISQTNTSKLSRTQQSFYQSRKGTQFKKTLLNAQAAIKDSSINPQQGEEEGYLVKQTKTLKEMIDTANSDQRALSLIDDTLELFNNQELKEGRRDRERYELINKEEFEKMKKDNEEFKKQKKILSEEYLKIKEAYEKVNFELSNMNYTYFSVEKQKKDSITKIYQYECDVKKLLIGNAKLSNEIAKEQIEKDNIFRALNEFSNKYDNAKLPKELNEIFKRIKNEKYSPMFNIDHKEKISILEEKISKMKFDLEDKDKTITELKLKIQKQTDN